MFRPRILGVCTGRCQANRIVPTTLVRGLSGDKGCNRKFTAARCLTTSLLSVSCRMLGRVPQGVSIARFRTTILGRHNLLDRVPPHCHAACFGRVVGDNCATNCCDCV